MAFGQKKAVPGMALAAIFCLLFGCAKGPESTDNEAAQPPISQDVAAGDDQFFDMNGVGTSMVGLKIDQDESGSALFAVNIPGTEHNRYDSRYRNLNFKVRLCPLSDSNAQQMAANLINGIRGTRGVHLMRGEILKSGMARAESSYIVSFYRPMVDGRKAKSMLAINQFLSDALLVSYASESGGGRVCEFNLEAPRVGRSSLKTRGGGVGRTTVEPSSPPDESRKDWFGRDNK